MSEKRHCNIQISGDVLVDLSTGGRVPRSLIFNAHMAWGVVFLLGLVEPIPHQ